jgi:hypothetical protein
VELVTIDLLRGLVKMATAKMAKAKMAKAKMAKAKISDKLIGKER